MSENTGGSLQVEQDIVAPVPRVRLSATYPRPYKVALDASAILLQEAQIEAGDPPRWGCCT